MTIEDYIFFVKMMLIVCDWRRKKWKKNRIEWVVLSLFIVGNCLFRYSTRRQTTAAVFERESPSLSSPVLSRRTHPSYSIRTRAYPDRFGQLLSSKVQTFLLVTPWCFKFIITTVVAPVVFSVEKAGTRNESDFWCLCSRWMPEECDASAYCRFR